MGMMCGPKSAIINLLLPILGPLVRSGMNIIIICSQQTLRLQASMLGPTYGRLVTVVYV